MTGAWSTVGTWKVLLVVPMRSKVQIKLIFYFYLFIFFKEFMEVLKTFHQEIFRASLSEV